MASTETETSSSLPSHKRTSSAAGNTEAPSQIKRQAQEQDTANHPQLEYVYLIVEDLRPQYTDPDTLIHGVYATLADANSALMSLVDMEYSGVEDFSRGVESDGRVYWVSEDTGEGDSTEIRIQVKKVAPAGSEPEREWDDEEEYGDEEEDEEKGGDEDDED